MFNYEFGQIINHLEKARVSNLSQAMPEQILKIQDRLKR
jgi:hypothetical protein